MLVSQVIQRLQELQRVESDVEVTVQDLNGDVIEEYYFDIGVNDGMHSVVIYLVQDKVISDTHLQEEVVTEEVLPEEVVIQDIQEPYIQC